MRARSKALWPLVANLFDPQLHVGVNWIERIPECALPEEMAFVRDAAPARRREYLAGRSLSRALLHRLGVSGYHLKTGSHGEPLWPPGTTGSITHGGGVCGVVVGRLDLVSGVGFDVEPSVALGVRAWPHVLVGEEQDWVEMLPADRRGLMATLLLSCKESVTKACLAATGECLDFPDFQIDVPLNCGTFRALPRAFVSTRCTGLATNEGRFAIGRRFLFTAFTWMRDGRRTTADRAHYLPGGIEVTSSWLLGPV